MQKQIKSKGGWKIIHLTHQKQAKVYIKIPISSSSRSIIYYGQIQPLYDQTQQKIVFKKYFQFDQAFKQTQSKIMNLQSNHILTPIQIIKYQGQNPQYYEIYEYCQNGTLQSYYDTHHRDNISKSFILNIIYGILTGYQTLKNNSILHGDITPKSVFINKKLVLLGDIGIKNINIASQQDQYSIYYTSPERLLQQKQTTIKQTKYNKQLNETDFAQDIYSLGILFYELIHAAHPYRLNFNLDFAQKNDLNNRNQEYILYITSKSNLQKLKYPKLIKWNENQQNFLNIVQSMISIDPTSRPLFQQIITAFRSIYNPSHQQLQKSFMTNNRSYLSKNNISNMSFSDISSVWQMNTSNNYQFLKNKQIIKIKINYAYINFLNKRDLLLSKRINNSTFKQQDLAELKNLLMNLVDKQQSLDTDYSEQQLYNQMTPAISLSLNILNQIKEVRTKQDIKLVKYLFDCHSIFVTKQQLRMKQTYNQFENEDNQEQMLAQINNLCAEYFIVPKKLVV